MRARILLPLMLGTLAAATPLAAQDLRGRVVDERSRQGLRGAEVTLLDAEGASRARATTDDSGFFRLRAPSAGTFTLVVAHEGYAEHRGEVRVPAGENTIPAVVLNAEVVPLDPLDVEARARERGRGDPEPGGFQRASHIIAGESLARLERHGGTLMTAVKEMSSLRTREYKDRSGRDHTCVESVRAAPTGLQIGGTVMGGNPTGAPAGCTWVAIVVDGLIAGGESDRTFRQLQLANFESVEYLPPAEAGRLYGMDASLAGALVLWTRGRGPHVSDARNR